MIQFLTSSVKSSEKPRIVIKRRNHIVSHLHFTKAINTPLQMFCIPVSKGHSFAQMVPRGFYHKLLNGGTTEIIHMMRRIKI